MVLGGESRNGFLEPLRCELKANKGPLMRPRLKLFADHSGRSLESYVGHDVAMPLSEFTRILADAARSDRSWLQDLRGETVRISPDLYELMRMYDLIQAADRA